MRDALRKTPGIAVSGAELSLHSRFGSEIPISAMDHGPVAVHLDAPEAETSYIRRNGVRRSSVCHDKQALAAMQDTVGVSHCLHGDDRRSGEQDRAVRTTDADIRASGRSGSA